jgi:hypothetical protein
MSTYYKFICKECEHSGGSLIRSASGWDLEKDESETFLKNHVLCSFRGGRQTYDNITIVDEHDDRYRDEYDT